MATERSAPSTVTEALCPNTIAVNQAGFTLIELSIVLVVIGLIVGGVLVGRDLISAAAVRAQISQIEKYQAAVNTFRGKYNYLPGDIPDPDATKFGFTSRGIYRADGDGNGQIEGDWGNGTPRMVIFAGEAALFWVDLTKANLIDGGFTAAAGNVSVPPSCGGCVIKSGSSPNLDNYVPQAKLGNGNYVMVYSSLSSGCCGVMVNGGINYFGLIPIASANGHGDITITSLILSAKQAYDIDKKIDDGLPQTGNTTAQLPYNNNVVFASGSVASGTYGTSDTSATPASATTCFDNGGIAGTQQYSITQNNGTGMNCALSFKFQ